MAIRVEGEEEVARALRAIADEIKDPQDAFEIIGKLGSALVREVVPKRTGRLARSARPRKRRHGVAIVVGGLKRVPYAGPINYGWPARNIVGAHFKEAGDKRLEPLAETELDKHIDRQIRQRGMNQ